MPALPANLFNLVEQAVVNARRTAEEATRAVVSILSVDQSEPFGKLTPDQRRLRNALRAKARQLGGGSQTQGFEPLIEEIAYQQWHRMLFARFLAENGLLMHPDGVPVTLAECAELAPHEGEPDGWSLAARYASDMLPGIFGTDDPAVQVRFAPEGHSQLEDILNGLPPLVFTADDSLGWMYQFWQSQKEKEVRASERKIGGADLAPVTQRFTEDYMVRFLLENSLGAWWAAHHPDSPLLAEFAYLRFREDGTPAAGDFPGWPQRAADVTVMDPCCGSGHFLVAAFEMLRRMRMEEEDLDAAQAADAALRDNLFGLELDSRCTQIAAFALALTAWKASGYHPLPVPNLACSGIPVEGQLETWTRLAGHDANLRAALERLCHLFRQAPDLGSLIDPTDVPLRDRMFTPDYTRVEPLLAQALAQECGDDPVAAVFGAAAAGVAKAARLLTGKYTLVATNVPYLGFKKQDDVLKLFCESRHPDAKMDLATVFVERCRVFARPGGTCALVTPQNWLFVGSYKRLRPRMLREQRWHHLSWLGPRAFGTISGEIVKPILIIVSNQKPEAGHIVTGMDASKARTVYEKAKQLRETRLQAVEQASQLRNPDARFTLEEAKQITLLKQYAVSPRGIVSGDADYWIRCFWEVPLPYRSWRFLQSTVRITQPFGGREHIINWISQGKGMLRPGLANPAYGHHGVSVSQTGELPCTLYTGELYDNNSTVIVPNDPKHLPAIWAFCQTPKFSEAVRRIDRKLGVTNATVVKIPFDLARWQAVADAAGPLPEPHSNDPTQWLFQGHPVGSTEPLQVAVARLLGYRWPHQEPDGLDTLADEDGILCLPAVVGELPAAERLRAFLDTAYGPDWSPGRQAELLAGVGCAGQDLSEWLRDSFFEQHCRLFDNRPFIWHIWDGLKDGFSALVNYHRLNAACLDKLIYTYLGEWIRVQRGRRDAGESGAEGRLVAALGLQRKLEAIRAGEPPHDIYVRWKPLHQQPIGWDPDLNDGVRLNIRPFVTAEVLRSRFTIHWKKDRGRNPDGSDRINDRHCTVAEKQAARQAANPSP